MFVRWKRRQLKRRPEPVYNHEPARLSAYCGGGHKRYIRNSGWQQHARARGINPSDVLTRPAPVEYALDAVLVESSRLEGAPRQRYLGHLATIREDDCSATSPQQRIRFWDSVVKRLGALEVSEADAAKIIAALAKRVPEVTPEVRASERNWMDMAGIAP